MIFAASATAQMQTGYVRTQGTSATPNGTRLSKVQVRIKGLSSPKVTDANGNFNFILGSGQKQFSILSVRRDGYRLLTKLAPSYNVGPAPVEVVMQSIKERELSEKRIRERVTRNIDTYYQAQIDKLLKEIGTLKKKLATEQHNKEALLARINELEMRVEAEDNQYQKRNELIDKIVEEYVDIDYATLPNSTAVNLRSFIEAGELEKADSLLNTIDIKKLMKSIKVQESHLAKDKEVASLYWRGKYEVALQRLQFDSAAVYIKQLAELDTCNTSQMLESASFLINQNDFKPAEKYSLSVVRRLSRSTTPANLPFLAAAYGNLSLLYRKTRRFSESEQMANKSLEIHKQLAALKPTAYDEKVAMAYNNLAILYRQTQRFAESEQMLNEAVATIKRLADDPKSENDLAIFYCNLATLYSHLQRFTEAEQMLKAATEIFERLAQANPERFEPKLAEVCNQWGNTYFNTKQFQEAEQKYKAAIEIFSRLAQANPKVYEPQLAKAYKNLGKTYMHTRQYAEAELNYKAAFDIYDRLAKTNPKAYEERFTECQKALQTLKKEHANSAA